MNKQILQKKLEAKKALLCSPLETLEEMMGYRGMEKWVLAGQLNKQGLHIDNILAFVGSRIPINNEIAKALDGIFEIPESFWLNLQSNYEAELKEIEELEKQLNQ